MNGLDPMARAEIIRLFRQLADAGMYLIISSHILHEVDMMSDSVVLLDNGYVVAEGPDAGFKAESPPEWQRASSYRKGGIAPEERGVMSDATLAKVLRTNGGASFTVHGFRSTFRDWAAENGFADSWAEAALAHTNPNRTESAYRRTTFFDQRRYVLMPAWAKFVASKEPAIA